MALTLSAALAILAANAQVGYIDQGAGVAKLAIYDGARPAGPDTAVTSQNKLVEFNLPDPCFGAAVDGAQGATATANAITAVNAGLSGTAAWFRIVNGDGNPVIDGLVTDTAGAGDLKVSSTAIISGIEVSVVSLTFLQPKL